MCYTLQSSDSRFLVLEYQRGEGDEQFSLMRLEAVSSKDPTLFSSKKDVGPTADDKEQEYTSTCNIISRKIAVKILSDDTASYHMNITSKEYLERVITIFEGIGLVRANGAVQALDKICQPARDLMKVELNPVELVLLVSERFAQTKAENRCCIL